MIAFSSTLSAETITAIAAVVVAVAALGISLWQGVVTRQHNQLSVQPHLKFDRVFLTPDEATRICLKNVGVGPAFIKGFAIEVDGTPVTGSGWVAFQTALAQLDLPPEVAFFVPYTGEAMASGDEITLIKFPMLNNDQEHVGAANTLLRLQFRVEYQSIYGKRFVVVGPPPPYGPNVAIRFHQKVSG